MRPFVAIVALFAYLVHAASAAAKDNVDKKAVLLLDAITFPKIVPNSNHDVVVLVSQKSQFGDYGTDSMRTDYFNFAYKAQTQGDAADHVIFAQVIVNGAENRNLADEIGVGDVFSQPKMFIYPAGSKTAIQYPEHEPFHLPTLTQFTGKHSSLQFQLPGTMKQFDEIAANFVRTDATRQAALIFQAESALEELVDAGEVEAGNYYVKVMHRIQDHGLDFIDKEIKRQTRLMNDASKLTKAGARNIQHHLNVLNHFKASVPAVPIRDEF
jgi:hypothetical protein